jgi:predicted nuclease of predicted toxin-antitoxin system
MAWKRSKPLTRQELSETLRQYRKKARFLVDESLGAEVARLLRRLGWNVKDVWELGMNGQPDENILAFAMRDDRVLLTDDPDFLDAKRFPRHRNPGIVVLPGAEGNERALLRALSETLAVVGAARDLYRATRIRISNDGVWTVQTFEPSEGRVVTTRYRFAKGGFLEVWEDE